MLQVRATEIEEEEEEESNFSAVHSNKKREKETQVKHTLSSGRA
jgi:hypothetical protein